MPHGGHICVVCNYCERHHSSHRCTAADNGRIEVLGSCFNAMQRERGRQWAIQENIHLYNQDEELAVEEARRQHYARYGGYNPAGGNHHHSEGGYPPRRHGGHDAPRPGHHRHGHHGQERHGYRHGYGPDHHRRGYGHPSETYGRHHPRQHDYGYFEDTYGRHHRRPRGHEYPEDPYRHHGRRHHGYGYPEDSYGRQHHRPRGHEYPEDHNRHHGRRHHGYGFDENPYGPWGHDDHGQRAQPGFDRPYHGGNREPNYGRLPPSEVNDTSSEGGLFSDGSDNDFAPGPSRRREHPAHGRHGGRRPGDPFGDHHRRPASDSDSGHGYPFDGARGFYGGHGPYGGRRRGTYGRNRSDVPPFGDDGMLDFEPPEPEEPKPNFYEVLEVPETATAEECAKAGKKKLVKVHPDRHPEDRDDPEKLKHWTDEAAKVTEAQDTLGDEAKKAKYDRQLRRRRLLGIF